MFCFSGNETDVNNKIWEGQQGQEWEEMTWGKCDMSLRTTEALHLEPSQIFL